MRRGWQPTRDMGSESLPKGKGTAAQCAHTEGGYEWRDRRETFLITKQWNPNTLISSGFYADGAAGCATDACGVTASADKSLRPLSFLLAHPPEPVFRKHRQRSTLRGGNHTKHTQHNTHTSPRNKNNHTMRQLRPPTFGWRAKTSLYLTMNVNDDKLSMHTTLP